MKFSSFDENLKNENLINDRELEGEDDGEGIEVSQYDNSAESPVLNLEDEFVALEKKLQELVTWLRNTINQNSVQNAVKIRASLLSESKVLREAKFKENEKTQELLKTIKKVCHECVEKFRDSVSFIDDDDDDINDEDDSLEFTESEEEDFIFQ